MTGNMSKIRKWGKMLDACFTTFQVTTRADDVYGDPAAPALEHGPGVRPGSRLIPFQYFVGWKKGRAARRPSVRELEDVEPVHRDPPAG